MVQPRARQGEGVPTEPLAAQVRRRCADVTPTVGFGFRSPSIAMVPEFGGMPGSWKYVDDPAMGPQVSAANVGSIAATPVDPIAFIRGRFVNGLVRA